MSTKSIQPTNNLFASIDMGSNSFKLIIIRFEPETSRFTTINNHSSSVVLGRNSYNFICPETRIRAIETLVEFQSILHSYNVSPTRTRVVGTSALREAINQRDFVENLGSDFRVDVISGFDEGRLVYLGVNQFFPVYDKKVLIVDIGGGSIEFVIGENREVLFVESLRLGHVILTERFKGKDLVGLIRSYVYDEILASGLVGKVKDFGFEVGIGSSGTIRAIEKAIWSGFGFNKKAVRKREWWWFSREELRVFIEGLCKGLDSEEERVRRDMEFGRRSEFIVAGAVVLDVIMELLEISEMRVSGYALGEGVVAEMMLECFPECDLNENLRWKSVMRLAMRFNGKDRMRSCAQCATTAKVIFEGLKEYNNVDGIYRTDVFLQEKDLEYLQAACMLHNIGLYYGKEGYHKRSCSIIMEHGQGQLDGFTTDEIEFIAQLARHHRKKFPSFECASLLGFSGEVMKKFGILSCILRISFVIKKEKMLKHKEINFFHEREGFVLALFQKEDQQMQPDLQKSIVDDIQRKIAKEVQLFEKVYDKKILVVAQKGYVESHAKQ